MSRVGAIDVGGTTVKVGVFDHGNFATARPDRPTPLGSDAVIDLVCEIAEELRVDGELDAIGVAVPGIVDDTTGFGTWSVNLGWRDVPFRERLSHRLELPVYFGHDVRCGGLAEARLGAGQGVGDQIFVPIGTGISAAIVLGGQLYSGAGWVGEIGHGDVGHDERCACGLTGCLEAVASGAAIARRYTAHGAQPVKGAADVVALVRSGDTVATRVWGEALDGLATALAWTTTVLAPEVMVLGGGVALAGDEVFFDPLRARLDDRLSFQRRPTLVQAALGDRAGCIGAGVAALDLIGSHV